MVKDTVPDTAARAPRILITGSRNWTDRGIIYRALVSAWDKFERVLKWLDTEVTVPVSDDMGVWLGLHVVPVGVLRAAAAEMGRA